MRQFGWSERAWALVRIGLGSMQVIAAATGMLLIPNMGMHPVSLIAVAIAGALLLASLCLFRNADARRPSGDERQ